MIDIDSLLKTFNFKLFHYGVAFDEVPTNWFVRILTRRATWKRYWIFRKGGITCGDEEAWVLCKHTDLWDEKHYLFYKSSDIGDRKKILYFSNSQEPTSILESLKSKLDSNSLRDHTLFNTKDLGW